MYLSESLTLTRYIEYDLENDTDPNCFVAFLEMCT